MKKSTLLLLLFVSPAAAFAQSLLNPGFENWSNNTETQTTYLAPDNWITEDEFNTAFYTDSVYAVHSVTQTTSAHSGSYAVHMAVVTSNEGDTVAGFIATGVSVTTFFNEIFSGQMVGYGFTARPANFSGYYKATTLGLDQAEIGIFLTKWNGSSRDTLVDTTITLSNAAAWTAFNIPLTYHYGVYPDSIYVASGITALAGNGTVGSNMSLDDLSFSGSVPIGVNEIATPQLTTNVYPNPFRETATITFTAPVENATIELYDVTGKLVRTIANVSGTAATIDREGMSSGIYCYRVIGRAGWIASGKISVE